MSNNAIDIINYDIPKFNVDINFNYVKYTDAEEDLEISDEKLNLKYNNENMNLYNELKIDISEFILRYRFDSNITFLNEIDQNIINDIRYFENKNLNTYNNNNSNIVEIDYFNYSNSKIDDKFVSIINYLPRNNLRNILNTFNISNSTYNLNKSNYRNIIIGKDYVYNFFLNKNNTLHNTDFINNDILSNYNNITDHIFSSGYSPKVFNINNIENNILEQFTSNVNINLQNDQIDNLDQMALLDKLNYFKISNISQFAEIKQKTGVAFVGFLIKKNKKSKSGESKLNIASQFIYLNINDSLYSNGTLNIISLFDGDLEYANSYSYEISPVFYLSYYKHNILINNIYTPGIVNNLIYSNTFRTIESSAIDYFAPEPPNALRIKLHKGNMNPILYWDHPTNPQNDVIGFQIYRREDLNNRFELIKVYLKNEINNFKNFELFSDNIDASLIEISNTNSMSKDLYQFIDTNVDIIKSNYIYAVCSIDAHGMVSNYSSQIGVRYSKVYNNLIIDHISVSNAPRSYPNLYIKRKTQLFNNDDYLFDFTPNFLNKEKISIYFTPDSYKFKNGNIEEESFNINNQYQLNIIRLNDLSSKNIKFKLKNQ